MKNTSNLPLMATKIPTSPDPLSAIRDTSFDVPLAEGLHCLSGGDDLDRVARQAADITAEHFGPIGDSSDATSTRRRMLLYAPLYLCSHCVNHCTYCGFRAPLRIAREHLSHELAMGEVHVLRKWGFRHILLVAGDFPRLTTPEYFAEIIRASLDRGVRSAVEIAPQATKDYRRMVEAGAVGVTLYQETYVERLYALYHPAGSKGSYDWRLEGLDRAAEAGMRRLGLGILLGLADPAEDLVALMRHACYLEDRYPDRTIAFSLPRIHQAPEGFVPPYEVDDETFVRLYCTLRIAFPRAELVLSTREPAELRNRLARICITQMSAGSRTTPGGYDHPSDSDDGQQFPVSDQRSPAEVAQWLSEAGFQPTWEVSR